MREGISSTFTLLRYSTSNTSMAADIRRRWTLQDKRHDGRVCVVPTMQKKIPDNTIRESGRMSASSFPTVCGVSCDHGCPVPIYCQVYRSYYAVLKARDVSTSPGVGGGVELRGISDGDGRSGGIT